MPKTLEELQEELERLNEEIARQNELRDSGSDDYDFDALDRAFNRRRHVQRDIEEAGGTPGGETPPSSDPPSNGTEPAEAPTPPRDPNESSIDQLRTELETLRNNPPHPSVRMEDGQVVGGTPEQFQEQLEWRSRVDRLQHELTAAEADQAWAAAGDPDGFTDAELRAVEEASTKIDGIQERLDAVNAQIAEKQAALDEAAGVMRSQQQQGGGPNAASGAAVAVGARLQGELRELHAQQAAIVQELNAALEELAAIIRNRVRAQLEGSGVGVDLPGDPKGKQAVEEAFLRRVYRRLGLPYLPVGGSGLLRGLTGAQSRGFDLRVALVALVALLLVVGGLLVLFNGGDGSTETTIGTDPVVDEPVSEETAQDSDAETDTGTVTEETNTVSETDSSEVAIDSDTGSVEPSPPPAASSILIPFACPSVWHSPLAGFAASLSYFELALLVAGVGGPIPPGSTLTVDAGGISPNSAPIDGATAVVPIPIDHFGTYPVSSVTAQGPDGPIPVDVLVGDVVVGSSEGPIDGCGSPLDVLDAGGLELGDPDVLYFGDSPLVDPGSGGGSGSAAGDPQSSPPDFDLFLNTFGQAHDNGDADTLFDLLDVATIDRYGPDQCRAYLGQVVGSVTGPMLLSAEPGVFSYETDGLATEIPDAWRLQIEAELGGSPVQVPMHVRPAADGGVRWFTDCGDPIP